jgi:hypothetical protein
VKIPVGTAGEPFYRIGVDEWEWQKEVCRVCLITIPTGRDLCEVHINADPALPYPWCSRPEYCAKKGYCDKDPNCGE